MNGWNGPIVTISRPVRRLVVSVLALAASCLPALAQAPGQGRESAVLEGVNMAVVMPVDLASSAANAECGLTEQLVNMIVAQRNFQANAQMISTQDQVTQTVINIR